MGWLTEIKIHDFTFVLTNFTSQIDLHISLSDEETINLIKTRDTRLFEAMEAILEIKDELVTVKEVEEHGVKYYFGRNSPINPEWHIGDAYTVLSSQYAKQETKTEVKNLLPYLQGRAARREREKVKANKRAPLRDKGHIYLIRAHLDNRPYKIGWTKNLNSRTKLFEVNLPFGFEVIHSFEADNARQAEALLHETYATKRLNGEWFDLSDSEAENIKLILEYKNGKFCVQVEN